MTGIGPPTPPTPPPGTSDYTPDLNYTPGLDYTPGVPNADPGELNYTPGPASPTPIPQDYTPGTPSAPSATNPSPLAEASDQAVQQEQDVLRGTAFAPNPAEGSGWSVVQPLTPPPTETDAYTGKPSGDSFTGLPKSDPYAGQPTPDPTDIPGTPTAGPTPQGAPSDQAAYGSYGTADPGMTPSDAGIHYSPQELGLLQQNQELLTYLDYLSSAYSYGSSVPGIGDFESLKTALTVPSISDLKAPAVDGGASLGRWLSTDPSLQIIGRANSDPLPSDPELINLYRYVLNSPVTLGDPTGLQQTGDDLPSITSLYQKHADYFDLTVSIPVGGWVALTESIAWSNRGPGVVFSQGISLGVPGFSATFVAGSIANTGHPASNELVLSKLGGFSVGYQFGYYGEMGGSWSPISNDVSAELGAGYPFNAGLGVSYGINLNDLYSDLMSSISSLMAQISIARSGISPFYGGP